MRTGWIRLGLIMFLAVSCADANLKLREGETVPQDLSAESVSMTASSRAVQKKDRSEKSSIYQIRIKPSDEWTLLSDESGIKTYIEANPKRDKVAFRGEVLIPAPITKVLTIMNEPELRKEWVDSLVESRLIEMKNSFERIEYNLTKVPWPFQNRDFLYRVKTKLSFQPASVRLSMSSVEDERVPPREGVVRGEISFCEYLIQEQKTARGVNTRVIVEMAVDPMGAIPSWLVNLAQKRWPKNTLGRMRRVALRPSIVVPKEIEMVFNQRKTKGSI